MIGRSSEGEESVAAGLLADGATLWPRRSLSDALRNTFYFVRHFAR